VSRRTKPLSCRVSVEDFERISRICDELEITRSDFVKLAIMRYLADVQVEKPEVMRDLLLIKLEHLRREEEKIYRVFKMLVMMNLGTGLHHL